MWAECVREYWPLHICKMRLTLSASLSLSFSLSLSCGRLRQTLVEKTSELLHKLHKRGGNGKEEIDQKRGEKAVKGRGGGELSGRRTILCWCSKEKGENVIVGRGGILWRKSDAYKTYLATE